MVAALGLTCSHERETLVIVVRLVLSPKECRQVRQDEGLGLAAKHVADPRRGVVSLRLHPVVGPDRGRQCLACFSRAAGLGLGHGQRQPGTGAVGEEGRRLFQQRHGLLRSALAILRQSADEQRVRIGRKDFWCGGQGLVHERDRARSSSPEAGSSRQARLSRSAMAHWSVLSLGRSRRALRAQRYASSLPRNAQSGA